MTAALLAVTACSLVAISPTFQRDLRVQFLPLNDEYILLPNVGKFLPENGVCIPEDICLILNLISDWSKMCSLMRFIQFPSPKPAC
jgi:hypothetical protein